MYNAELISFKGLSDQEKSGASNNGAGKEWADYIRITDDAGTYVESDAMEPEDARFGRDLRWIVKALNTAYQIGRIDAATEIGKYNDKESVIDEILGKY